MKRKKAHGAVYCGCGARSDVRDSRPVRNSVRRRRLCAKCGRRWSTVEIRLGDNRVDFAAFKLRLQSLEGEITSMLQSLEGISP